MPFDDGKTITLRNRVACNGRLPLAVALPISALRLIHNWSRPHPSLAKGTRLAMAMGYINQPVSIREMLSVQGYQCLLR